MPSSASRTIVAPIYVISVNWFVIYPKVYEEKSNERYSIDFSGTIADAILRADSSGILTFKQ